MIWHIFVMILYVTQYAIFAGFVSTMKTEFLFFAKRARRTILVKAWGIAMNFDVHYTSRTLLAKMPLKQNKCMYFPSFCFLQLPLEKFSLTV